MPTRKQRRREAKQKRHEYEFVYVDDEGNEVDTPPEELEAESKEREERRNGRAAPAKTGKGRPQQRGGRQARVPPPPSWERAARRSAILGAVVFVLFYMTGKGSNRLFAAIELAAIYTVLFVPFTYAIDRFAYRRWQAREQAGGTSDKKPPKRR
jgi:hypothetical protein